MNFYLPTYEECKEIVATNDAFYESKVVVDGYEISIFNYRIAEYNDFVNPIPGKDIKATELRGLTFIHDGENVRRNLMLHKFFNLNQCQTYQYGDVINHKIVNVAEKCDGSMIRFIRLPNGRVVAKTKMDFNNDQCKMAQAVYDHNPHLQDFVRQTLDAGLVAIYELVGIRNRIVVEYKNTDLILLQLRCEETGKYHDIYNHELVKSYSGKIAYREEKNLSLDEYVSLAKNLEGTEGWILTLSNGQMLKVKTEWYRNLHGILTNSLCHEAEIIGMVLGDTLDDAISQVDATDIRYKYATTIQKAVFKYLIESEKKVLELINDFKGNRKEWAQKHLNNSFFPNAAQCLGKENVNDSVYKSLKERIRRETYRLEQARSWLREQGVSLEDITVGDGEE